MAASGTTGKSSTRRARRGPASSGEASVTAPRVGRIVACERGGALLVEFDGCERPIPARALAGLSAALKPTQEGGDDVLIVFDGGDRRRPVVVGLIDTPRGVDAPAAIPTQGITPRPFHAVVDGRNVTISAEDHVELRCGKGSITVRKDGKIVIRGTHLLSRSTGAVRIKGGHVEIN